jgi:pantothenate kinase type III
MLVATFLGVFIIPGNYTFMQSLGSRRRARKAAAAAAAAELNDEPDGHSGGVEHPHDASH